MIGILKYVRLAFLVIVIMTLIPSSVIALTYYVSPLGDNNNPGTAEDPFKTLGHAATMILPGDTIIAFDGIYYENYNSNNEIGLYIRKGGAVNKRVVFKAKNKGKAIIDGANESVNTGIFVDKGVDYITIEGFEIKDFKESGITVYGSHALIKNNIIHNIANFSDTDSSYGKVGIYTDAVGHEHIIDGNIIHHCGRLSLDVSHPNGNKDHGIYLCSKNSAITNNLIYENQAFGIHVAGYYDASDIIVSNNTIVKEKNKSGIILWLEGCKNNIIQNNIIVENRQYGVDFLNDGGGHIIRNNIYYRNTFGSINPAFQSHFSGSDNFTVNPLLNGDYVPSDESPAIDAGYMGLAPKEDLRGIPRPQGAGVDIGCYEKDDLPPQKPEGLKILD